MKHLNLKKFIFLFLISTGNVAFSQINKTPVVEHFTNTSCSICAANNDGFYNVLANHPNALHISFHPSKPYASDFFNQQNKSENDERTIFYNIFGSTPRLVVNGSLIQSSSLNSVLTNVSSEMSAYSIDSRQIRSGNADFKVEIVIKKLAADTSSIAYLFCGVVEDTIYQTTNNGEKVHYNVFRKSLTQNNYQIGLPAGIGDSVLVKFDFTGDSGWDNDRLHSVSILHKTDGSVINSSKTVNSIQNGTANGPVSLKVKPFHFNPNPNSTGILYSGQDLETLNVYSTNGELISSFTNIKKGQNILIDNLKSGMYFLAGGNKDQIYRGKLLME